MTSAYVVASEEADASRVTADLAEVGITVPGAGSVRTMVGEVIRACPDVVVCYEMHPDDEFFSGIEALNRSSPRPTVVFTDDPDAEKIERAARMGIHSYVVNGYGRHRLRPLIHVAKARFGYIESLRGELADITHRFSERKLIDQAKAILMRLRNLPEDEAYGALRTTAMKANRRMGHVARQVIEAARYGDAINRAGHLRMSAQRLALLYALRCTGQPPDSVARLIETTLARVEANLATLARTLSKPTFGDLLERVTAPFAGLKAAMSATPAIAKLPTIDALAERLMTEAEHLTTTLETTGFPQGLRLINVSGRQRMLSQRYAKQALIGTLLPGEAGRASREALGSTATDYRAAMVYLSAVPLRTPAITGLFATATAAWEALEVAHGRAGLPDGQRDLLAASETLLATFEDLTEHYERNLQALMQTTTEPRRPA